MSLFSYKYLLKTKPKLRIICTEPKGKGEQEEQDLYSGMRLQDGERLWEQLSLQGPDPTGASWGVIYAHGSNRITSSRVLHIFMPHLLFINCTLTQNAFWEYLLKKFRKIETFIKASKHARSKEASLPILNIFLSSGNDEVLFQQRLRLTFASQPSTRNTLNAGDRRATLDISVCSECLLGSQSSPQGCPDSPRHWASFGDWLDEGWDGQEW